MTKDQIKSAAAEFIKDAKLTDEWSQEAHNAFVARLLNRSLKLTPAQIKTLIEAQQAIGALTANASAFRQWLQSKDVALLAKPAEGATLGNRYGSLI